MLGEIDAAANLAVRDVASARRFYEDVLGLTPTGGQGEEVVTYRSGRTTLNVYRSEHAGTNKATAVTWAVPDIDGVVQSLKAKGVAFERYAMPGLTLEGEVHVGYGMKVAWFKDPAGNILNLIEG